MHLHWLYLLPYSMCCECIPTKMHLRIMLASYNYGTSSQLMVRLYVAHALGIQGRHCARSLGGGGNNFMGERFTSKYDLPLGDTLLRGAGYFVTVVLRRRLAFTTGLFMMQL